MPETKGQQPELSDADLVRIFNSSTKHYDSRLSFIEACKSIVSDTDDRWGTQAAFLTRYFGREAANRIFGEDISKFYVTFNYDNNEIIGVDDLTNALPTNLNGSDRDTVLNSIWNFALNDKKKYAEERLSGSLDRVRMAQGRCNVLSELIMEEFNEKFKNLKLFRITIDGPSILDEAPLYLEALDQHHILGLPIDGTDNICLIDTTVAQMEKNKNIDVEVTIILKNSYQEYIQLRYGTYPVEDNLRFYPAEPGVLDQVVIFDD
jgi:hypothetical protein